MGVQLAQNHSQRIFLSNFLLSSLAFWREAMAAKRITMRKIRDILRLRLAAGLSIRQIKASTRVSIGSIQKLLSQAEHLGLSWPLPDELDDNQLAQLFYPGTDTTVSARFQLPDWSEVHQELKRKGMTLQLLWEAYTQQYPNRQLLIIDDWGLEPLKPAQRNDLMEIMDDRHGFNSTLMISQLPIDQWYASIGDNTLADAILDRLMHNAHRLQLKGESMRKIRAQLNNDEHLS
jgi:hypothetical protein